MQSVDLWSELKPDIYDSLDGMLAKETGIKAIKCDMLWGDCQIMRVELFCLNREAVSWYYQIYLRRIENPISDQCLQYCLSAKEKLRW